jgi:hypothetical protein
MKANIKLLAITDILAAIKKICSFETKIHCRVEKNTTRFVASSE